jgi:hypothetical protein
MGAQPGSYLFIKCYLWATRNRFGRAATVCSPNRIWTWAYPSNHPFLPRVGCVGRVTRITPIVVRKASTCFRDHRRTSLWLADLTLLQHVSYLRKISYLRKMKRAPVFILGSVPDGAMWRCTQSRPRHHAADSESVASHGTLGARGCDDPRRIRSCDGGLQRTTVDIC